MTKTEIIQKLLDEKKITAEEAVVLLKETAEKVRELYNSKNNGKQLLHD